MSVSIQYKPEEVGDAQARAVLREESLSLLSMSDEGLRLWVLRNPHRIHLLPPLIRMLLAQWQEEQGKKHGAL